MATKADTKKMPSIVSKNTRYFYEVDKQGKKIIRHILIGSPENILQIPSDGQITIDTLPADSVGSEEIKNESVKMEDLAPEVKEGLDELNNVSITDKEIEEIFYPSENNDIDGDDDVDDEL